MFFFGSGEYDLIIPSMKRETAILSLVDLILGANKLNLTD